ncbi:MAG: acyclic terpene utilization AtuA family protein [Tateyamaria sp.]|uniref:acyclic terpene utilization AtuA family protein n=1 Tax=Tateyamaria sp. TaxID=1929288 RepID=UPI00329D1B1D
MTRVLIPSGALGLGFDHDALMQGIANKPDIIAIDGGSTDSGPAYLGQGVSKYSAASTRVEWRALLLARAQAGVPLVIGTAGTCGADSTVDWLFELTKQIAKAEGLSLKIALLYSGQSPKDIARALHGGTLQPLPAAPDIDTQIIENCTNIVALAGAEQIQAALKTSADVIIAGRATDTATIAALPLMRGDHPGAAWHGAKVGECGALATSRPNSGVIQIDFDKTGFTIEPLAADTFATPGSVSAHMLYENSDPFELYEPGGHLDVTHATYAALDARSVRVEGSIWVPGPYTVKIEGARVAGYQSVSIAMLRERRYVENVQSWADDITAKCRAKVIDRMELDPADFQIDLRLIGVNAVLGALETQTSSPHEVGVMGVVTAPSADLALEINKMLNPYLLHHPLEEDEPMPTFAFPFSPPEMARGAIYEFCLHHILTLDDPMAAFKLETHEVAHA